MFFPCFVSKSNINKYATPVSSILSEPYHPSPYEIGRASCRERV